MHTAPTRRGALHTPIIATIVYVAVYFPREHKDYREEKRKEGKTLPTASSANLPDQTTADLLDQQFRQNPFLTNSS